MLIKADQKFIRTSPRKIRQVADGIKHLSPAAALVQLQFSPRRASTIVAKALRQALANATNNLTLDPATLRIHSIEINEGPTYKRYRAVSRGRPHSIMKRTSHITVTLIQKELPSPAPVVVPPTIQSKQKRSNGSKS